MRNAVLAIEYREPTGALLTAHLHACQAGIAKAGRRQLAKALRGLSDCLSRQDQNPYWSWCSATYSPGRVGSTSTLEQAVEQIEGTIATACDDDLAKALRSSTCGSASTVADLASCLATEHVDATGEFAGILR
jgi:hypothetical protein